MVLMQPEAVVVFRSARVQTCEERALVLTAVGIKNATGFDYPWHVLIVDAADAAAATEQLLQYQAERSQPRAAPPPVLPRHPYAWVGAAIYALVITAIGIAVANGFWPAGAYQAGAMDAGLLRHGQWWRAWTALTLHADGTHLAANLMGGIWYGGWAGLALGPGHAWLLTVLAAGAANGIEGLLAPATHRSIGASTAVFAALGVLCAHAWRTRAAWIHHWAWRLAPLVGGLVLLAWTGTGGINLNDGSSTTAAPDHVDVVAHILGFAVGAAFGALAAGRRVQFWLQRIPQWASGALALGVIAISWICALR